MPSCDTCGFGGKLHTLLCCKKVICATCYNQVLLGGGRRCTHCRKPNIEVIDYGQQVPSSVPNNFAQGSNIDDNSSPHTQFSTQNIFSGNGNGNDNDDDERTTVEEDTEREADRKALELYRSTGIVSQLSFVRKKDPSLSSIWEEDYNALDIEPSSSSIVYDAYDPRKDVRLRYFHRVLQTTAENTEIPMVVPPTTEDVEELMLLDALRASLVVMGDKDTAELMRYNMRLAKLQREQEAAMQMGTVADEYEDEELNMRMPQAMQSMPDDSDDSLASEDEYQEVDEEQDFEAESDSGSEYSSESDYDSLEDESEFLKRFRAAAERDELDGSMQDWWDGYNAVRRRLKQKSDEALRAQRRNICACGLGELLNRLLGLPTNSDALATAYNGILGCLEACFDPRCFKDICCCCCCGENIIDRMVGMPSNSTTDKLLPMFCRACCPVMYLEDDSEFGDDEDEDDEQMAARMARELAALDNMQENVFVAPAYRESLNAMANTDHQQISSRSAQRRRLRDKKRNPWRSTDSMGQTKKKKKKDRSRRKEREHEKHMDEKDGEGGYSSGGGSKSMPVVEAQEITGDSEKSQGFSDKEGARRGRAGRRGSTRSAEERASDKENAYYNEMSSSSGGGRVRRNPALAYDSYSSSVASLRQAPPRQQQPVAHTSAHAFQGSTLRAPPAAASAVVPAVALGGAAGQPYAYYTSDSSTPAVGARRRRHDT